MKTISQSVRIYNSKKLFPYFEVQKYGHISDSCLSNGAFIKFLSNIDTLDRNLYIQYGNKNFDSIYVQEDCIPTTDCRTPFLFFGTEKYIALVHVCSNEKGMILLPLNKKDSIKYFTPIFIDTSNQILLVEDYEKYGTNNPSNCFDTLTISDFNFKRQKEFVISHMVCGNKLSCIDTVYINKKSIILKSIASTFCDNKHNPKSKIEKTEIPWLK